MKKELIYIPKLSEILDQIGLPPLDL